MHIHYGHKSYETVMLCSAELENLVVAQGADCWESCGGAHDGPDDTGHHPRGGHPFGPKTRGLAGLASLDVFSRVSLLHLWLWAMEFSIHNWYHSICRCQFLLDSLQFFQFTICPCFACASGAPCPGCAAGSALGALTAWQCWEWPWRRSLWAKTIQCRHWMRRPSMFVYRRYLMQGFPNTNCSTHVQVMAAQAHCGIVGATTWEISCGSCASSWALNSEVMPKII